MHDFLVAEGKALVALRGGKALPDGALFGNLTLIRRRSTANSTTTVFRLMTRAR